MGALLRQNVVEVCDAGHPSFSKHGWQEPSHTRKSLVGEISWLHSKSCAGDTRSRATGLFRMNPRQMKPVPRIIPPRSRVRLVHADHATPRWKRELGRQFRIGYYNRKDGLDCIWLVNEKGEYEQTSDGDSLLRLFNIEKLTDERDYFGVHKRRLGPPGAPSLRSLQGWDSTVLNSVGSSSSQALQNEWRASDAERRIFCEECAARVDSRSSLIDVMILGKIKIPKSFVESMRKDSARMGHAAVNWLNISIPLKITLANDFRPDPSGRCAGRHTPTSQREAL
jgi:hypothetical protein